MSYLKENLYTKVPLKFNKDGKFKILMFSDTHGKNNYDKQSVAAIKTVVENVKPDLVLIGGDMCHKFKADTIEDVYQMIYDYIKDITSVLEENNIPWAHVFGNHDSESCTTKEQQAIYERFEHNIAKRGPEDFMGVANYVLPIKAHDSDEVVYNVWGLDSLNGVGGEADYFKFNTDNVTLPKGFTDPVGYAFIPFEEIMWYWNSSVEMEKHFGKKIPGMMFFHTPVPEFWLAQENPIETNLEGFRGEACGNSPLNSGLFTTILQRGDVKTICCGHDHHNDYSATYCGIKLCMDGGLSYDGYCRNTVRGGRVFEIDEKDPWNINTYMVHYFDMTDDPEKYRST